MQFATGKMRCSGRIASAFTSGTISGTPSRMRNVELLSITTAPLSTQAPGELGAGVFAAREEHRIVPPRREGLSRRRADRDLPAAEMERQIALARGERAELVDGHRSFVEDARDRLADDAGHADDRDSHAAPPSSRSVEPDDEPAPRADAPDRKQHAGHERIAAQRIVAYREDLALAAEEHLLVRDEPAQANAVDRHFGMGRVRGDPPRRQARGTAGLVQFTVVVQFDDLDGGEIARGFFGESHHQDGAEREVRHEGRGHPEALAARAEFGLVLRRPAR